MNCATFEELVPELADGLVVAEKAEEAHAHAAGCSDCAERLDSLRRFGRLLDGRGDGAINAWKAQLASDHAAEEPSDVPAPDFAAPAPVRRVFPYAAVAAASLIVAVGVASFLGGPAVLAEDRPTSLARGSHVLASEGRELEVEDLAQVVVPRGSDGAVVRLDEGTVLFRVAPGHLFAVETPQGIATAIGTSFHVAVNEAHQVSVAVHSGSVRFATDRETTLLGVGDRLEIDATGVQRLINRRRLDDLQTDLAASREAAARLRREQESRPGAGPSLGTGADGRPVGEAIRAFFESEEGRKLLSSEIRAVKGDVPAADAQPPK